MMRGTEPTSKSGPVPTPSERERLARLYAERVDSYPDAPPGYAQRWRKWCRFLLSHGGELVVPHLAPDDFLERLLSSATVSSVSKLRLVQGSPSSCHANVSALWAQARVEAIGTGYALSADGLWRQHSWGLAGPDVVETT